MTDATVLADALVEAEILHTEHGCNEYWPYGYGHKTNKVLRGEFAIQYFKSAEQAIADGRVVMKVLESYDLDKLNAEIEWQGVEWLTDPRAIIEAWYAAQETGDDG